MPPSVQWRPSNSSGEKSIGTQALAAMARGERAMGGEEGLVPRQVAQGDHQGADWVSDSMSTLADERLKMGDGTDSD
jgi:hypothetical protein